MRNLLLCGIGFALAACGEAATAKLDAPLRKSPGTDREIVTLVPRGSAVKLSGCAHGWCEVSWQGQKGYALAKNFVTAGQENRSTERSADEDQFKQEDGSEGGDR
jgi:uncharacterized protein YraI